MAKSYNIVFSSRVDKMVTDHVSFIARVSISAAKQFRRELADILKRIEDNPYQFPVDTDLNLPEDMYRKALFAKRYKVLFMLENQTVYVDAIVDCRQNLTDFEAMH